MCRDTVDTATNQNRTNADSIQDIKELEQYRTDEAIGLLIRLPVPLGTAVWQVKNNPACHRWVQDAETFLYGKVITPKQVIVQIPFTLDLLNEWGYTVFLTEAECMELIKNDASE